MIRSRLEHKVLLLIVLALVIGLGLSVIISIGRESARLEAHHEKQSRLFAETLMAGFRNVMLSGRAGYVRQLVEDARQQYRPYGRLRLFDNEAGEIFPERGALLARPTEEPLIAALFDAPATRTFGATRLGPLYNETRCHSCHGDDHALRGATWVSLKETEVLPARIAGELLATAFKQIMVSGQGALADTLLQDAATIGGLRFVQVYDNTGTYPAFGDLDRELDPQVLAEAIALFESNVNASPQQALSGQEHLLLVPLPNEERCYVCHGDDHALRGVLALGYEPALGQTGSLEERLRLALETFNTGFRSMMLVESGTHSGQFVAAARALSFVEQVRVFTRKDKGPVEVYVQNEQPDTVAASLVERVRQVIAQVNEADLEAPAEPLIFAEERQGEPFLVQVISIKNELRCQACHTPPRPGSPDYLKMRDRWKVRTVVEVASSLTEIQEEIQRNARLSLLVGLATLLVVWVILHFFMKRFVIQPIAVIGGTAREIGSGNLRARAQLRSGDELGRLARQINEMADGLRERLELAKFVSAETLDAVRLSQEGVKLGGERKQRTLFFSDIRGFTAYAEKVEPEQVVAMLNTYLREETQIVQKWGGDIDKFVGDELVATFDDEEPHPENMVVRAARCAWAVQQRMQELNRQLQGHEIGIGIGINTGQVILGAMGSEARMDYTVLGDAVNTAARLCSAAQAGQIILSAAACEYLEDQNRIQVRQLPPLRVKNKSEPLIVYEVVGVELSG